MLMRVHDLHKLKSQHGKIGNLLRVQPALSTKQLDHLVPRIVDVNLHRLAGFFGLACLDGLKNVGMSNPSRYGLCAKGIEASYIVERQINLSDYPLVAGEFGQPPVKLCIGPKNIRQDCTRVVFRDNDRTQFLDLLRRSPFPPPFRLRNIRAACDIRTYR